MNNGMNGQCFANSFMLLVFSWSPRNDSLFVHPSGRDVCS